MQINEKPQISDLVSQDDENIPQIQNLKHESFLK